MEGAGAEMKRLHSGFEACLGRAPCPPDRTDVRLTGLVKTMSERLELRGRFCTLGSDSRFSGPKGTTVAKKGDRHVHSGVSGEAAGR
jgi:hypothetical protein